MYAEEYADKPESLREKIEVFLGLSLLYGVAAAFGIAIIGFILLLLGRIFFGEDFFNI